MPRIPLSQLYPEMDKYPPRWVRQEDGQYVADFSNYPEHGARWSISHRDPLTGCLMVTLPVVETEADLDAADAAEVMEYVVDREQGNDADDGEDAQADADAGATQSAA